MANISISLKKYKADYSRFLHNAKVLRLTFQTPAQRNDNPTWACAESSSPKKLLPAAYCRYRVLYLKVPNIFRRERSDDRKCVCCSQAKKRWAIPEKFRPLCHRQPSKKSGIVYCLSVQRDWSVIDVVDERRVRRAWINFVSSSPCSCS